MSDSDSPAEYRALAADGGVHVWHGSTRDAPPAAALRLLSTAERTVMQSRPRTEGLWYAGAHITVRQILSRYLGVPAAGLRFGTRPCPWCADPGHGRPVVTGPPTDLDFNLSHAGPHWVLAVSTAGPVGIDIEDGRSGSSAGASALTLSDSELTYVSGLMEGDAREAAFLRCWTRKEAVLKAIGTGITADLKGLEVRPEHEGPLTVRSTGQGGTGEWLVQDLPGAGGLFVALARPAGSHGPVTLRSLTSAAGAAPGTRAVPVPARDTTANSSLVPFRS
ncbi:4'-phosphopantetheinyl transferase superfamily protein [Streptomyces rubiginosohelvolus]|uniref:4'-phosphopantetheinyl transferase family protein n=1 Tax=Streptomyces rubiginosohelvolus TaxID=67362 RepID=UPI0034063242